MPDIDFASFNPRSFEQFAQALAGDVLGPGLLVFGDGPDGGREAEFDGEVPYPTGASRWKGRICMQAKFLQRPARDRRDADWLVAQLAGEAARMASRRDIPRFYLLVTNVRLSGGKSTRGKGGQTKLDEAFERHLAPLGVKAMHIWHDEKIATLLDGHPDLLRSYGAWLAPREVLSAVFEKLSDEVPDFGSTMMRFLQREFREQRATRMQQAGYVDDAPTPLERIFVDLPYGLDFDGMEGRMAVMSEILPGRGTTGGLLGDLLALTSLKLDPATLRATWPAAAGPAPARHLVVGGPGQGKSTISQFLAQVARARILLARPQHLISADILPLLDAVRGRMDELGLAPDGVARYPVRLDLPTFADALATAGAAGQPLSMLEHVAARIAAGASVPGLGAATLRRWLAGYPWLLVLDGLDEVPPSANRGQLLDAIVAFWDEATGVNADVAMVITSRPQGYNDDLDPRLHVRHEMVRLDAGRALAYARGVASLKMPEERRERVLGRLAAAAENPTTALLMGSPLQVAILLQLVDQRGTAPTDRWTLFDEYLSVVVKREQEKPGEAGRVVRERAFVIDEMLRRAGLLLHVESEQQGGAQAFLTLDRLRDLARAVLVEDGHEGERLDGWAAEIVAAATDRLVFLEQRVQGRVEFDVRSLQEFMAAAELMGGDDAKVGERLHAIVGSNHWQHVYRIAASKAFSVRDAAKYRDTVLSANLRLETENGGARAVRRGGAMALELLSDGVAHDQPRFARALLEQAAALLELGPDALDHRLIEAFRIRSPDDAVRTLAPRLGSASEEERLTAWSVVFVLVAEQNDRFDNMATANWPADPLTRLEIAAAVAPPHEGSNADRLVRDTFAAATPAAVAAALHRFSRRTGVRLHPALAKRMPYLVLLRGGTEESRAKVGVLEARDPTMMMRFLSIDPSGRSEFNSIPDTEEWRPVHTVRAFLDSPDRIGLAVFARSLSDRAVAVAMDHVALPWIVATIAALARRGHDPAELAAAARDGRFGDASDWKAAEERWRVRGVTAADLDLWCQGTFFDERVAQVGAPYASHLSQTVGRGRNDDWLRSLLRALHRAVDDAPLDQMRRIALFALPELPIDGLALSDLTRLLPDPADRRWRVQANLVDSFAPEALLDPVGMETLAVIGVRDGFLLADADAATGEDLAVELLLRRSDVGALKFGVALLASRPARLRTFAKLVGDDLGGLDEKTLPELILLNWLAGKAGVEDAISAIVQVKEETLAQHAVLALAENGPVTAAEADAILVGLVTRLGTARTVLRGSAVAALRRRLDQGTSDLRDGATWSRLGLPQSLFSMLTPLKSV